jgi:hypothetical protein
MIFSAAIALPFGVLVFGRFRRSFAMGGKGPA